MGLAHYCRWLDDARHAPQRRAGAVVCVAAQPAEARVVRGVTPRLGRGGGCATRLQLKLISIVGTIKT